MAGIADSAGYSVCKEEKEAEEKRIVPCKGYSPLKKNGY
jgi:hypothetical protein